MEVSQSLVQKRNVLLVPGSEIVMWHNTSPSIIHFHQKEGKPLCCLPTCWTNRLCDLFLSVYYFQAINRNWPKHEPLGMKKYFFTKQVCPASYSFLYSILLHCYNGFIFFLHSTARACSLCCWLCSGWKHCHLLLWKLMPEVAGLVRVCWVNHLMEHDIVRYPLSFIYSSLIFSLTFPGCYHLLINRPGTKGIFNVLWLYCKPLPLYYPDVCYPGLN